MAAKKIVILYKRGAQPDTQLLSLLESALSPPEYDVFIDRHLKIGVEWARVIEEKIRGADAVIALLSDAALSSEMLEYEVEITLDERLRHQAPLLLPIRIGSDLPPKGTVGSLLSSIQYSTWHGTADNATVLSEIVDVLTATCSPEPQEALVDLPLKTLPPESPMYIQRPTDSELRKALDERESIILIKGPRQVGKTSLIAHGIRMQRERGGRFVTSDFQQLTSAHIADEDTCYRVLAANMARQLKFRYDFDTEWLPMFGPGSNFHNFLRALVLSSETPLAWFMDEVDRLFTASFSGDFFALVRSWHGAQAMEPDVDWSRLSIVITYATEAHLFIQDLNQSPFNVGRQLALRNFDFAQTEELNERYGTPLRNVDQVQWLFEQIEGHPALTRRALDYLVKTGGDLRRLMANALAEDGPFGDHLRRVLVSVSHLDGVMTAMRESLSNVMLRDSIDVQRLIAAGILVRRPSGNYAVRCNLYRQYLELHLRQGKGSP